MGSLRGGIIAAFLPGTALASGTCAQMRPLWTPGAAATPWDELLGLMAAPPSLLLLVLSALVIRLRHAKGALIVTVAWSFWISALTFYASGSDGYRAALAEGCIGSPALFIATVAAICIAMILYTTRRI